jgi:hypothetical protein
MLTFPLSMTFDELAVHAERLEPDFADNNMPSDPDPDDDCTISSFLRDMMDSGGFIIRPEITPEQIEADRKSEYYSLPDYLRDAGFKVFEDRVEVEHAAVLHLASAIFNQIAFEYDRIIEPVVARDQHMPTWALFNLGGDDDVDYCSSHPSYVTDLLLRLLAE